MSDPTLIADLVRAGLAPELLQRVVLELARGMAEREAAERRRANDRIRKTFPPSDIPWNSAEYTELHGTVGTVGTVGNAAPSRARSTENPSLLSQESKEEKREERKGRARGRSLPAEWTPKAGHYAEATARGFDVAWVMARADDMRVWAEANRNRAVARKANWDSTFTSWMRREFERHHGRYNGKDRSVQDAASDLVERLSRTDSFAGMPPDIRG